MEHLLQDGMSASNITNNITGIRSMYIVYGLDTAAVRDRRIPLFLKAIKITRPLKPVLLLRLDVHLLENILQICQMLQHPSVFKALYTFCFFTFLRISNILPYTMASFDLSRQLCRADVVFGHSKAVVIIKWSEDRCRTTSITIPVLGASPLCPVTALTAMFNRFPALNDSPLFQVPSHSGLVPFTDSVARKHLKNISIALSLNKSLTLHDFRRAGASWAFQHGVPLQAIQAQGT